MSIVCLNNHWMVVCIEDLGNLSRFIASGEECWRKDFGGRPCIATTDFIEDLGQNVTYAEMMQAYLVEEFMSKNVVGNNHPSGREMESFCSIRKRLRKAFRIVHQPVPRQRNCTDCGIFALMNVKEFLIDPSRFFVAVERPYSRRGPLSEMFYFDSVCDFREKIRDFFKALM